MPVNPVPRKPAAEKARRGTYLPVLPDGWRWEAQAKGPNAGATITRVAVGGDEGGLRVELGSPLVKPPVSHAPDLAAAAQIVARLARLHETVAAFAPAAPDQPKKPAATHAVTVGVSDD